MATLIAKPASALEVGDEVCGDYGVTYKVAHVDYQSHRVCITWHTGRTIYAPFDHVFHVETA